MCFRYSRNVKVIILAGGLGTRISEETSDKPKPMVLIGAKPILWHVMNIFACQGYSDFVIATGYKSEVVQSWVNQLSEPWNVVAFDTGLETQTGGRIKKCIEAHPSDSYFITYGDGLGNINLSSLVATHKNQGKLATVTAVRPPARFGVLEIENGIVTHFGEKNQVDAGWINGGFFVVQREVAAIIENEAILFETGPLPRLARQNELAAYQHQGFWQPMDTLRERDLLISLARDTTPPWLDIN